MKNLRPVVWSKGMFLTPQHFQAQDRYYTDYLQFRFAQSLYANWGISALTIDREALANGSFSLVSARGILPDGLPFDIPNVDLAPASRPIADHWAPNQESLEVYLALPEERPRGKNITHASGEPARFSGATRYIAENADVIDANTGDEAKTVQLGRKNFRLLFGDEIIDGFTTIQIAQVVRDQDSQPILQPEFVVSCLDVQSSGYLMGLLKRQVELLHNKSVTLAASRRQKGQGLADFTTSDIARFWLLHTVNSCLPELNHIWKTRRGHPEQVFVLLLRLAGALSTFAIEAPVPELPDYDHDNLGPCFTALDAQIRSLLETVIPTKCFSIPLRLERNQFIWNGVITNDRYLHDTQFVLAVSSPMRTDETIRKVQDLVKISAPSDIQYLINLALPGVPLSHLPVPPAAIPVRLDNQYFRLETNQKLWEQVARSRNVSIFVPEAIPDAKLELLVVLK